MILIFDTYAGLVNQFYDIYYSICFCKVYNIRFSFRYCSFRSPDLQNFFPEPFERLFDKSFLKGEKLYLDYSIIKSDIKPYNCFNFGGSAAISLYKKEHLLKQILSHNKKYVVIRQIWTLAMGRDYKTNIYSLIRPTNFLLQRYIKIRSSLIKEPYNFIHYRYEKDFTSHFKVTVSNLDNILKDTTFANNKLKIFIATSNIQNLIDLKNEKYKNLLFKNDNTLLDLNFEQRAFIDYMFGLESVECYGHSKSSFSRMLNDLKGTQNYYA